jgi:hypothetical protein
MKFWSLVAGGSVPEAGRDFSPNSLHNPARSVQATVDSAAQASAETRRHGSRSEFLAATIVTVAAATAVIAPMLVLGTVAGRDFSFHLASWMDVAQQWHHGTIYPQWAEWANWCRGEPRFVFYPPGSWMVGAALGSVFPWTVVPTLFNWLALIGSGMSMYLLARECLPQRQAALAAMLFAANPYHLLLVYYRSDFAELLASAFFPLLPRGVMRIARDGWRGVPILALSVAFVWLSNAPAAVIAVYSVVLLLFVAYVLRRDLRLLLYGALATAVGFGLAAFYILPAAHERTWVQIHQVLSDGLRPEQNFLFSRPTSMAVNTDFNFKISCVVLLMGILIAIAASSFAKSPELPRFHYWLLFSLGALSFFMMFRFSRPLWLFAPELHFVQFPWRYAVPLGVAFSFFLAAACKFRNLEIVAITVFVFAGPLAKIWLAVERPSSWKSAEISQFLQKIDSEGGYRGTPEYLPNGAHGQVVSELSSDSEAREADNAFPGNDWKADNRNNFIVQAASPQEITLHAFNYPTRQVDVDGSLSSKLTDRYGRIVVRVPSGKHVVHISARRGWDAKLGIAISLSTAVLLSYLMFLSVRKGQFAAVQRPDLESKFSSSALSNSPIPVKSPMENREHS